MRAILFLVLMLTATLSTRAQEQRVHDHLVSVFIGQFNSAPFPGVRIEVHDRRSTEVVATATTGADGFAHLRNVPYARSYLVVPWKAGEVFRQSLPGGQLGHTAAEFVMPPPDSVPADWPATPAMWFRSVRPDEREPDDYTISGVVSGGDRGLQGAVAVGLTRRNDPEAWRYITWTDEAGRFRLSGLHAGEYTVRPIATPNLQFAPAFRHIELAPNEGQEPRAHFSLRENRPPAGGYRFDGHIRGVGENLNGLFIALHRCRDDGFRAAGRDGEDRCQQWEQGIHHRPANDGRFHLTNLDSGYYRISVHDPENTYAASPSAHYVMAPGDYAHDHDFLVQVRTARISGRVLGDCPPAGAYFGRGERGRCSPGTSKPWGTARARIRLQRCEGMNSPCGDLGIGAGASLLIADNSGRFITQPLSPGYYRLSVDPDLAALGSVYRDAEVPGHQVRWNPGSSMLHIEDNSTPQVTFRWNLLPAAQRQQGLTSESGDSGFGAKGARLKLAPQTPNSKISSTGFQVQQRDRAMTRNPALKAQADKGTAGTSVFSSVGKPRPESSLIPKVSPKPAAHLSRQSTPESLRQSEAKAPATLSLVKKPTVSGHADPARLELTLRAGSGSGSIGEHMVLDASIRNVGGSAARAVNWYLAGHAAKNPGVNDRLQQGSFSALKTNGRKNLKLKIASKEAGKWRFKLCVEYHQGEAGNTPETDCSALINLVVSEPAKVQSASKPVTRQALQQLEVTRPASSPRLNSLDGRKVERKVKEREKRGRAD